MNLVIAGCSFSSPVPSESGWNKENTHLQYTNIVSEHLNCTTTNVAIGGCSNREIFTRTVEACVTNETDACIVQWSALDRLWLYEDTTVDDYTQITPAVRGRLSFPESANSINKHFVSHYQNNYMFLKHWLIDQITLQSFLKQNRIPYVFVRAFKSFVAELEHLSKQDLKDGIPGLDIPDTIKTMLDFDNNPDSYLFDKLTVLLSLYSKIDKSKCVGYNSIDSMYGLDYNYKNINDVADDGVHPGKITNRNVASQILENLNEQLI
jgi:hypothetical protein